MENSPSLGHVIGVLLVFIGTVEAYDKFETTCTIPSERANFVSSPNTRGTLDILWSSLFTIFACTWTIQHLNVPEQRRGRDPGTWGDCKWKLRGLWRSTKWMLITVIAPDIILGKAAMDLLAARKSYKDMKKFAAEDGVEWTITHAFYANMGGIVASADPKYKHKTGVDQQEELMRGGQELKTFSEADRQREESGDGWDGTFKVVALTADDLLWLRKKGHLEKLPRLSYEELNDKSKGDAFVKLISLVQVLFSIIQIIVRRAKSLPISQLELGAVAFSTCAVVTYGLLFQKPQNIQTALEPVFVDGAVFQGKHRNHGVFRTAVLHTDTDSRNDWYENRIPNDATYDGYFNTWLSVNFAGIVFGSIHVAGWNLEAPTQVEQSMWRAASILMTTYGVIVILCLFGLYELQLLFSFSRGAADVTEIIIKWACGMIYVVARVFIIVEMFRTLGFLPPQAYLSTWTTNFPHVG